MGTSTKAPRTFLTSRQSGKFDIDAWRRVLNDAYFGLDFEADRDRFTARMQVDPVGSLQLSHVSCGPSEVVRRRESSQGDDEYLMLILVIRGSRSFTHHGRNGLLEEGDLVLLNSTEEFSVRTIGDGAHTVLKIPGGELRRRLTGVDDLCARRSTSSAVLTSMVAGALRGLDRAYASGSDLEGVEDACLDLVATMLDSWRSPGCEPTASGSSILHRLRRHLQMNLSDPELSAEDTARACGVSLRSLQRLFQTGGSTFRDELRILRLERADRLLREATHLSIGAIAYASGFASQAHFAVAYRARFGRSPREGRRSTMTG